jgi:ubiquitin-like protein Pup
MQRRIEQQRNHKDRTVDEDAAAVEIEHTKPRHDLTREMDEILDEIDEVLEENAEEFVKAYVQKGGE